MTEATNEGWTIATVKEHFTTLREADQRFLDLQDRKYASEAELRAEALRVRQTADAEALRLAAEAQRLRDQQTERLRDDTLSKSGVYVTKDHLNQVLEELKTSIADGLKPLVAYISSQKGADGATTSMNTKQLAWAGIAVGVVVGLLKYLGI